MIKNFPGKKFDRNKYLDFEKVANSFIEAINIKFAANIPQVNPNDYAGNELPILP